ncbi:MAG: hypothetical protein ACP5OZ_02070 [Candidatus Woesearchaeota archaeon]
MLQQILLGKNALKNRSLESNLERKINDFPKYCSSTVSLKETNGIKLRCLTITGVDEVKFYMEEKSLIEHFEKHKIQEVFNEEDYLRFAAETYFLGRNYKDGKLYKGYFLGYSKSEELKGIVVHTLYRRFF